VTDGRAKTAGGVRDVAVLGFGANLRIVMDPNRPFEMLLRMRRYECLECGAEYGVIELRVPAGARPAAHCLHCGSAFPDTHARYCNTPS
jgi:hypothetical protein